MTPLMIDEGWDEGNWLHLMRPRTTVQQKYATLTGKTYNPDEPRVQSGSEHGQWTTSVDSAPTRGEPPPDPSRIDQPWNANLFDSGAEESDARARNAYNKQIIATLAAAGHHVDGELTGVDMRQLRRQNAERLSVSSGLALPVVNDMQVGWQAEGSSPTSTAIVQAAAEQFGLKNNDTHEQRTMRTNALFASGGINGQASGARYADRDAFFSGAKQFVIAQYAYTQQVLAQEGFRPNDTITLYRGFRQQNPEFSGVGESWKAIDLRGRAASSWAADYAGAANFAGTDGDGYVVATSVKVKDILGTGHTGLADPTEREFVVLNGHRPVWARKVSE